MFCASNPKALDHQGTRELFSFEEGVEYVMQLLSCRAIKERVKIVFCQKEDRALAYFGDAFKFHQIVINLVLNALESYEGIVGGVEGRLVRIAIRQEGDFVELKVSDCGCGIPESVRAKIFEPFFTTKGGCKGMGIGLATVKKIVEQDFQGTVSVESEEGKGSAFTAVFPAEKR